jgi:hypothetical protein
VAKTLHQLANDLAGISERCRIVVQSAARSGAMSSAPSRSVKKYRGIGIFHLVGAGGIDLWTKPATVATGRLSPLKFK